MRTTHNTSAVLDQPEAASVTAWGQPDLVPSQLSRHSLIWHPTHSAVVVGIWNPQEAVTRSRAICQVSSA